MFIVVISLTFDTSYISSPLKAQYADFHANTCKIYGTSKEMVLEIDKYVQVLSYVCFEQLFCLENVKKIHNT